jgi:CHAT domain-containing protein
VERWLAAAPNAGEYVNNAITVARLLLQSSGPTRVQLQVGLEALEAAERIATEHGLDTQRATLWSSYAALLLRMQDITEAARVLEKSLPSPGDLARAGGDLRFQLEENRLFGPELRSFEAQNALMPLAPIALISSLQRAPDYSLAINRAELVFRVLARASSGQVSPRLSRVAFSIAASVVSGRLDQVLHLSAASASERSDAVLDAAAEVRESLGSLMRAEDALLEAWRVARVTRAEEDVTLQIGDLVTLGGRGLGFEDSASWVDPPCSSSLWGSVERVARRPILTPGQGVWDRLLLPEVGDTLPAVGEAKSQRDAERANHLARLSELYTAVRSATPDTRRRWGSALEAEGTSYDDLARRLGRRDALAIIFAIGDTVAVVTNTPLGPRVVAAADRGIIRDMIVRLRAEVAVPPPPNWTPRPMPTVAYELFQALLAPVLAGRREAPSKLYVLLGEDIADLPLNALITQSWQPNRAFVEQAWLDRAIAVQLFHGLRAFYSLPGDQSNSVRSGYVGLGNPTLEGRIDNCREQGSVRRVADLCPVPQTATMLERLARIEASPEKRFLSLGPDAVLEAIRQSDMISRMRSARVIAFATHGLISAEAAVLTGDAEPGLVLTPVAGRDDGMLRASEIASLGLTADLVILAACGTGVRDGGAGSWRGIADAFLIAGARALLTTSWSVDIDATDNLVRLFTRDIQRLRQDPSLALRTGIQQFRSEAARLEPRRLHPFFWSGLQVSGLSRPQTAATQAR